MRLSSYGCTRNIAKQERGAKVVRGDGPVRLSLFDCLATVCMRPEVDLRMLTMKDL